MKKSVDATSEIGLLLSFPETAVIDVRQLCAWLGILEWAKSPRNPMDEQLAKVLA